MKLPGQTPSIYLAGLLVLITLGVQFSPARQKPVVCTTTAFAAWQPMPALRYSCKGLDNEWDEKKILKLPSRIAAKRILVNRRASFSSESWWRTSPSDLSACDVRRKPGKLTEAEKEKLDY